MIKIYYKQCLCDMLSMMGNRMLFVCLTLMCVMGVQAQDDDFKKSMDEFRRGAYKEYDDFRKQALMEYSDFVRQAWKPFNAEPAVPMPKEEEVAPMLAPDADQETASWFRERLNLRNPNLRNPSLRNRSPRSPRLKSLSPRTSRKPRNLWNWPSSKLSRLHQ